mgnify:CR=1 FL=1|tara:strand:+ start:51 stop:521 length:471 start_codon:yes stop_codon:yes gene_type:complete
MKCDKNRFGKIYAIACGPYVKVGMTHGPVKERMKSLQAGNPVQMSIMFEAVVDEQQLGATTGQVEYAIHKKLDSFKVRGEWFQIDRSQVISSILEVIEGWEPVTKVQETLPGKTFMVRVTEEQMKYLDSRIRDQTICDWLHRAVIERIERQKKIAS